MRIKNFSTTVGLQIFKSLSEEPRIRIMNLLWKFEKLSISDLEMVLDYTQAKTSRHVNFLKNAGLLTSKQNNQWVLYSIKDEVLDVLANLIRYMEKDPVLQKDIETCKILNSNRELSINKLQKNFYVSGGGKS
ncbi:MAG: metalloregulator ArsR/SmtB family transcription factor [Cytophagales bacterium]